MGWTLMTLKISSLMKLDKTLFLQKDHKHKKRKMNLTNMDIQKALRIKRAVNEYFENTSRTNVEARELMNLFIKRGIFAKNNQDGLPIRDFLRRLDENHNLQLIPQVHFEQMDKSKKWYFIKTGNENDIYHY